MIVKAFDKWDTANIKIEDPGLINYINLEPKIVPRSHGRYAGNRFHKSKIFIVERLINRLMVSGHKAKKHTRSSGHNSGKVQKTYEMVEKAFDLIETRTKKNPVEVFAKAVEKAAPREEIVTIEYGGARYPKAVECSPQRRVDVVLKLMVQGIYQKSFNTKKSAVEALADEIINAYNMSQNSAAIQKKLELERQADSSR
ncbi:30S ribosomal protein S7 [Candidatus Woesearchaeota archaeon]|nr:30S ribosomal protein S7 [Candidatus Woesearchaeota archaeon]